MCNKRFNALTNLIFLSSAFIIIILNHCIVNYSVSLEVIDVAQLV